MRIALRLLGVASLGAALAAVVTYALMKPPNYRHPVTPVEQGRLYRSGQLTAEQLAEEIQRRGIKTIVNLGSRTNWDEEVCRRLGVRYVEIPAGDVWRMAGAPAPGVESAPEAPLDLSPLWRLVEDPQSQPVLMHCWGGVHRTGFAGAVYRMRYQGWSPEDALREMDLYGFDSHKDKFQSVRDYLRAYPEAQERTAQAPGAATTR